jgi:peptidoglycan/xylan/chitin deacetylase (PgdA/CDA1 family)
MVRRGDVLTRSRAGRVGLAVLLFGALVAVPSGTAPVQAIEVSSNQAATSATALASGADGSTLVVYRGLDDGVYYRTFRDGTWSAQAGLGGVIVGAPAVTALPGGGYIVAGRGATGALLIRRSEAGTWLPWQSLGGVLSAAPAIVSAPDGRIDVFGRGTNNALYTRTLLPGGSWSAWRRLGGTLNSGPAAVAFRSGRIEVYATGTDYRVRRIAYSAGTWSAWSSFGGRTYVAPAVAAAGAGTNLRLFIRDATTNALLMRTRTAGSWSGWQGMGGILIDAPAATGRPDGAVDVVVRGTTNALYGRMLRNGTWSSFARAWIPAARPDPPADRLGTDWTRIPTTSNVIALTFDAGANAAGLASIRATLQRENVPATFFLTGNWTRTYPASANQVALSGFVVGNHSNTHPHFTDLTDAQVTSQVVTAERAILLANGADSRPLFRFPYGDRNARVLADVNELGYVAVRWTVDSLGWQGTSGGQTTQRVVNRVLAAARPGAIVLMHIGSNPDDGTTLDAAALPQIIDGLQARGYQFVTLYALAR